MPVHIKQCAWEIYLRNMGNIVRNGALFFGIRYGFALFLNAAVPQPFLRQIAGILWTLVLVPMELWWIKSLLELVKGEALGPKSCLSLYGENGLCRIGITLELLCQALNLWFWGVGWGIASNGGAAAVLGQCVALLGWGTPFLLMLAVQPVYVDLLITPGKSFSRLVSGCWKAMGGYRGELLRLWASLAGWIALMLVCDLFMLLSRFWVAALFFQLLQIIASIAVMPYLALCGIFFSLRVLENKGA